MTKSLRLSRKLVVMNVMMTMEYRGAFVMYMLHAVMRPTISLLVWLTVREQQVNLPYDRSQLVTYYILLSGVSVLTASWMASWVAEQISLGGLSPWLLRPAPAYILTQAANNLGEKVVKLPLLLPMVAVVVLMFKERLRLPTDLRLWLLFALALPMAVAVAFLLDFVIGLLAFWVQDVQGVIRVTTLIGAFLAVVPLAFLPRSLAWFLEAHPFRYTLSFPLEVLTGDLSTGALVRGFAWQALYCVGLWSSYRWLWRRGLRTYSAMGS